jgi:hypothetical protein
MAVHVTSVTQSCGCTSTTLNTPQLTPSYESRAMQVSSNLGLLQYVPRGRLLIKTWRSTQY